jgi:hypothetical protein
MTDWNKVRKTSVKNEGSYKRSGTATMAERNFMKPTKSFTQRAAKKA